MRKKVEFQNDAKSRGSKTNLASSSQCLLESSPVQLGLWLVSWFNLFLPFQFNLLCPDWVIDYIFPCTVILSSHLWVFDLFGGI